MTPPKPMMAPTIDPEAIFAELRANEAQWQRRAIEAQAQAAHAYARLLDIAETSDTGQASRVAKFLAGTFNGQAHPFDLFDLAGIKIGGNYVDALNSDDLVVAQAGVSNGRWRVRDNMPGTREFCPTVRLTHQTVSAMGVDCQKMLGGVADRARQ